MTSAWHETQILCTSPGQPVSSSTRQPPSGCTTALTAHNAWVISSGLQGKDSWASSLEFQCAYGLCWYKAQLQIMIAASINLLSPHWLISAIPRAAAACCLHVPSHACSVCMQRLTVSQLHEGSDSICVPPPVFKLTSMLATKRRERRQWESTGGKRGHCVSDTQRCRSVASLYWEVQDRHFLSPELQPKRLWATVCISTIAALMLCMSHSQ